jgi:tetraacyldisaccharide 4'-kinase
MIPLIAAAGAFRAAIAVRNLWWRRMARRAGVPIVSVGNLTVGGNAKTPFTLYLASRLRERGLEVAIVSRGYGAIASRARATLVADRGDLKIPPDQAGDEPAMMARRFAGPIAIARRRIDAIEMLTRDRRLNAIVLDDGFQHTRLARDLDLVLVNDQRGFGNRRMLPAGPMREPLGALKRADAVVIVSFGGGLPSAIRPAEMKRLMRGRVFRARVGARGLVHSENGQWRETPAVLAGRRVLAVSGLADPSAFHAMVREIDADLVGVIEYPDHHAYTSADWQAISAAAREVDIVVTTEKDLVKLERFPFPRDSLYALRLEVSLAEQDARALDDLVFSRIGTNASGPDVQEVSRDAR